MPRKDITSERKEIKGKVRMELQDFKFVQGDTAGRMLRLTATERIDFLDGRYHAVSLVGCLIRRNPEGELQFQPPTTRNGRLYIQTVLVSPDFVKDILDIIGKSKYASDIGTGLDYNKQPDILADPPIEIL